MSGEDPSFRCQMLDVIRNVDSFQARKGYMGMIYMSLPIVAGIDHDGADRFYRTNLQLATIGLAYEREIFAFVSLREL